MEVGIILRKYQILAPELNERTLRVFAAAEALSLGRGGISIVSRALEISRDRISRGIKDIESKKKLYPGRIRQTGGGRKKLLKSDPTLKEDLQGLISPYTRGDPESPLRWTCKSVRKLADALNHKGHSVSHSTVSMLLRDMDYSLQANQKTMEGKQHPDRNAQFEYINKRVRSHQRTAQPVISVDTKKKEKVGDFKNGGQEWHPKGHPEIVRVHDFIDKELGKVAPYGVYDLTKNNGWVNVGIDHDTAAFAVASIRRWWRKMGRPAYSKASDLLITADSGGSNSSRNRLWKVELQKMANRTGLTITVCHFPPGTSKWNKIEHRMFSFITKNWRGKPLIDRATIVNLIGSTKTKEGLKIRCELDTRTYPKGIKVPDAQLEKVKLKKHKFHGDWNYTIYPNKKSESN
ncbi:MAG: ISAzo13 family transposase [Planctomycetota bacterium]|nr:ISAzo13 family transposase [Planctomycetota bacterium]